MEKKVIVSRSGAGLALTALASGLAMASAAHAQPESPSFRLEEIVVTAQRRTQSMQDVPVAVTALTQDMMAVNRVQSIQDLSGMAPNTVIRPSPGGVQNAQVSMRGVTSMGIVPGSDKQVSIYLDGVYIGSSQGSIFEFPDIAQLEVLRGPQGTLFGRNATAGAVSVTTRDPSGELGFIQDVSIGNRDYIRSRTSIDLPAWGPLSVSATYVTEERDGDIRNLAGGTQWDRSAFGYGNATASDRLGSKDVETVFFAAKYEPSDTFALTYKFDYTKDEGTPHGAAPIGAIPAYLGPGAPLLEGLLAVNPHMQAASDGKRPSAVYNAFSVPRDMTVQGHSLTAVWDINDSLTLKNITAYREQENFSPTELSGWGGLYAGPVGAAMGLPADALFCLACSQSSTDFEQWSNETQLNYSSEQLTLTAGLLYYESESSNGSPRNATNTFILTPFVPGPNGYIIPAAAEGLSYNDEKSGAFYTQAEFHLSPELDVIGGYRLTRDEKSGYYSYGLDPNKSALPFDYAKTKPTYMVGVNYKPSADMMLYAKYSTAYVSGGSVGGVAFEPEEVTSWEAGIKADFLDGRLRSNLAIFDATYENFQTSQAGVNVGHPELATVVVDLGTEVEAQGVELELTALPMEGLTLTGSMGYTDTQVAGQVDQRIFESVQGHLIPGSEYQSAWVPRWTGNLSANYETAPLFGNAYMSFNVTGLWRSKLPLLSNLAIADFHPEYRAIGHSGSTWVVNARAALSGIELGQFEGEIAVWGRNLTNDDSANYALGFGGFAYSGTYQEARTYGLDLRLRF